VTHAGGSPYAIVASKSASDFDLRQACRPPACAARHAKMNITVLLGPLDQRDNTSKAVYERDE
jgi:hypothetical protein